jgi:rubrerythrin
MKKMSQQDFDLVDAIQIAMEAEQKAAAFYADAAHKTANPMGQSLFEQLAEFERYHYQKLADLTKSLQDKGAFFGYEGRVLISPPHEIKSAEEPNKMSMIKIINLAIDTEREAENRYVALAKQTVDPDGRAMFNKLAQEEHNHYRVLGDVYWNLNNRGTWNWSP